MTNQVNEIWNYLMVRKKYWLLPLAISMLLILGAVVFFLIGSSNAPIIYNQS